MTFISHQNVCLFKKQCLVTIFFIAWKKAFIPFFFIKRASPFSFLQICSKILKKLTFKEIVSFFGEK